MGLGTIPARTNGQTIADTWFNILRTVLSGDVVPRNASGIVIDETASIGTTTYGWLYGYFQQLKVRANGNYVSVKAPSGLPANLDVILPANLPSSTVGKSMLTIDDVGQIERADMCGVINMFAGPICPAGWFECDGSEVSRTIYADLFNAIGTAWGNGDNSTTFNLPDMRGMIPRGYNHGKAAGNFDPDAASRTESGTGGATGDNVGTYQVDRNKAHTHNVFPQDVGAGTGAGSLSHASGPNGSTVTTTSNGGSDARPQNVAVMFIIKF